MDGDTPQIQKESKSGFARIMSPLASLGEKIRDMRVPLGTTRVTSRNILQVKTRSGWHNLAHLSTPTTSPSILDEFNTPAKPPLPPIVVHQTDIDRVKHAELVRVGEALELPENAWIAGGSIRRSYSGLPLDEGDIDIYLGPQNVAFMEDFLAKHFEAKGYKQVDSAKNTRAWSAEIDGKTYTVQHIAFTAPSAAAEIIDNFDLTICQGAYCPGSGKLTLSGSFEVDNKARVLRFHRIRSVAAFLKRYEKYAKLGYYLEEGSMTELAKRLVATPPGGEGQEGYHDG